MKLTEVRILSIVSLFVVIALLLGMRLGGDGSSSATLKYLDASLYIDELNTSSVNTILEGGDAIEWQPLGETVGELNLGYSAYSHWIKLQFNELPKSTRFLYLDYELLDTVEFYQITGNEIDRKLLTGDLKPFSSREFISDDFVFPLENITEKTIVYLKVSTKGIVKIPLSIKTVDQVINKTQLNDLMLGIYIGFMLFSIVGCLVVVLITKNNNFLFYGAYFAISLLSGLNFNGLLFHWVWPNTPEFNKYAINIIAYLLLYTQLLFVECYLKKFNARCTVILSVSKLAVLTGLSLSFAPGFYTFASLLSLIFIIYINFLSVLFSVSSFRSKEKNRKKELYFILAWFFHACSIYVLIFDFLNVVRFSSGVENYIIGAYAIQIVFLIVSIVDSYELNRKNSIQEAQKSVQELEQRQIIERHMLFQATHDSLSLLPKKQILLQNWPTIKEYIPKNRPTDVFIIHFEGYYSIVLAFGQEAADMLVSGLQERVKNEVSFNKQFSVIDYDWNNDKAVVLDSLDICLIYVEKESEDVNVTLLKLYEKISEPFKYQDINLDVVLSIGVNKQLPSETISSGIRKAQVASREASNRKIAFLQYQHTLGYDPEYTNILLSKFKKALKQDGLSLVFQPQVNTLTGKVFGAESLLRWSDEDEGILSPDMFIPIIEQSALINDLTDFVIRESFQFFQSFKTKFSHPIHLSLNLSARNFSDESLVQCISQYLTEYDVDPEYITFELTETAFLGDLESSKPAFNQLLELGVKLALDDFGTGYSSLAYLKELPFSELKIDKSFLIKDFHTKQGAGLVKAAIELGSSLDILVVAEGVESFELAKQLGTFGCYICQGFYFSKPMKVQEFEKWYSLYDSNKYMLRDQFEQKAT